MDSKENQETLEMEPMEKVWERRALEAKSKYRALEILADQQDKELRALILPLGQSPEGEEIIDYLRRLQKCILDIADNLNTYCSRRKFVDSYCEELESEEDRRARLMASLPQFEDNQQNSV